MTVRDLIETIRREVRDTDLQPSRAAELAAKLTALLGNVNAEIREADADYAQELLRCLDTHKSAAQARIVAETTPAFQRKREARDTKEVCLEMARSLKSLVKAYTDEMHANR